MSKEEKYKETKICKCIVCGADVTVTKFASALKVKCDKCKKSGAEPNKEIVSTVKAEVNKPIEPRSKYGGDTKICQCIKCGADVTVTKFASASKVVCDDCKGDDPGMYSAKNEIVLNPVIDLKKLDRNVVPVLEEYKTTPALIGNSQLRNVTCPACGHKYVKILKVLDWSTHGLIIHYQCPHCKLLVSLSEQCKHLIRYQCMGEMFDYSGESLTAGAGAVNSSRMSMAVMKLIGLLDANNIKIEGDDIPPYLYDEVRPVPVGYVIPDGDMAIKTVDDAISALSAIPEDGTITIDATTANNLVNRLKELYKEHE